MSGKDSVRIRQMVLTLHISLFKDMNRAHLSTRKMRRDFFTGEVNMNGGDVMLGGVRITGDEADNTLLFFNEDSQLEAENNKKHALLRFQSGIYDFQNDQHEILRDDEFVEELIKYLFRLSRHGHSEVAIRVLQKLGNYMCGGDPGSRDKSLYILSAFTSPGKRGKIVKHPHLSG